MRQLELKTGTCLDDRYEIIKTLGEGGFAHVYLALDKELSRKVAIKILKLDLADNSKLELERFKRESRALAQLQHPNIIRILSGQLIDDCTPIIVMEYLEGQTLRAFLSEQEKVNPELYINILLQAVEGLSHAHKAGFVHRDLSPANIFLLRESSELRVRLLDFGLSRMVNEATLKLTKTGQVLGSPAYMSPEQARGGQIDARSDIYSLGCVMYEMFCGKQAFYADTAIGIIYMQQNTYPAAPIFSLEDNNLEEKLKGIILKCLQKEPESRFQTCDELKAALCSDSLMDSHRLRSKDEWKLEPQGIKGLQGALLLFATIIICALGFSQIAIKQRTSSSLAKKAQAVKEEMPLEKTLQARIRMHGENSPILIGNLEEIAEYYERRTDWKNAVSMRERASRLRKMYYGDFDEKTNNLPPELSQTVASKKMLASDYLNAGNYEKSKQLFLEIIRYRKTSKKDYALELSWLYCQTGKCCLGLKQYEEAYNNFQQSSNLLKEYRLFAGSESSRLLNKHPDIESDLYLSFGRACLALNRKAEAKEHFSSGLKLIEQTDALNNSDPATRATYSEMQKTLKNELKLVDADPAAQ